MINGEKKLGHFIKQNWWTILILVFGISGYVWKLQGIAQQLNEHEAKSKIDTAIVQEISKKLDQKIFADSLHWHYLMKELDERLPKKK